MIMIERISVPGKPKAKPMGRLLMPKMSWFLVADSGAYGDDAKKLARQLWDEGRDFMLKYGNARK